MVEYITKEQAIGVVEEAIGNIVNSDSESVNLTDLEIEIQMTITDHTEPADVAPVVHGHWKFYDEDLYGHFLWRCTYCGNIVPEKAAKHFCTYCGARMDGGDGDV